MRNRTLAAAMTVVLTLTVSAVTLLAVKYGELDGDRHPYVGLMVAQDGEGRPMWRCSGTLLSPRLFLTAGHCTSGAAHVEIWFESDVTNAAALNYPFTGNVGGTPYSHPQYTDAAFSRYDLGVVVLDEDMVMPTYGVLPQLDELDRLSTRRGKQGTTFTAVGYGVQMSFPDPASWKEHNERKRYLATPKLLQINVPGFTGDYSLLLSNNANTGGTCFGDSGGPNFIGDSNVVGGVTSYAINGNCAGTGGVYRVDRADDLDWLSTFAGYMQ